MISHTIQHLSHQEDSDEYEANPSWSGRGGAPFFSKRSLPLRVIRNRLIPGILRIKHKTPCFPLEHFISRNNTEASLLLCIVAQVTSQNLHVRIQTRVLHLEL
ncbi:hypothetical protein BDV41DRAFT_529107, partial [Aspergillus transmontanensis]